MKMKHYALPLLLIILFTFTLVGCLDVDDNINNPTHLSLNTTYSRPVNDQGPTVLTFTTTDRARGL